jgi:hypothetical protein
LGQLKSTLYARMEELSFRSGAVVAGGVLTVAHGALRLEERGAGFIGSKGSRAQHGEDKKE